LIVVSHVFISASSLACLDFQRAPRSRMPMQGDSDTLRSLGPENCGFAEMASVSLWLIFNHADELAPAAFLAT
jgi:hypothetical protein